MIAAYELSGTATLLDIDGGGLLGGGTPDPYFREHLDPTKYTWTQVDYPASGFPMNTSMATGVANVEAAINATPGKFVLIGTSQGAAVISTVYDAIRSGSLSSRNSDFLGGVTFGNPRRQAGHTFPGCPDPGGNGIDYNNLLTGSETRWYDFANPGDVVAINDNTTTTGKINTALFNLINESPSGDLSLMTDLFIHGFKTVADAFYSLFYTLWDITSGPHQDYGTVAPLPGDIRGCMKIALDYLNSLS